MSPLNILALDTTTRGGSIAVARGGTLLAARAGDPSRTHGERLPVELMRAVDEAGLTAGDLDLLAVAAGPGSFTGLRVGVSAIQGLAVARGLKVVAVSTLDALARAAADVRRPERLIATWMDGQRGEVFGALYHADGTTLESPVAGSPVAVLRGWRLPAEAAVIFIGDGAVRYHDAITSQLGDRAQVIEPPLLAPTIARVAFEHPERAVAPHEIVPVYVRRPDAELARDRRQGRMSGRPLFERVRAPGDLDEVAALEAACFTNPWTREMLERDVQTDVTRVYVLRDEAGAVVAFCTCWVVLDELHVNTVAVDPGRRRAGLGTKLMNEVINEAVQAGARRATLEVRATNVPARELYAALGFTEAGRRPGYYTQPDDDAIVLWKELEARS